MAVICKCVCAGAPETGDAGAGRAGMRCPWWWSESCPVRDAKRGGKKGSSVVVSAAIKVASHPSAMPGPLAPPSMFCTRQTTAVRAIDFSLELHTNAALLFLHACCCGLQDGSPQGGPEAKFGSRSQPAEFELAGISHCGTNQGRPREYRHSYHQLNRPISPWLETERNHRATSPPHLKDNGNHSHLDMRSRQFSPIFIGRHQQHRAHAIATSPAVGTHFVNLRSIQ